MNRWFFIFQRYSVFGEKMKLIDLRRRMRRLDVLDIALIELSSLVLGLIIATYFISIRGFVEQNLFPVIFLFILISIRPMIKYLK